MTSIDEAYLPLNLINELKNDKLCYIKDLYINIDNLSLNDINIEGFDAEVLKSECAKYKKEIQSYFEKFRTQQKELVTLNEKLNTLVSMQNTNEEKFENENLYNCLNSIIENITKEKNMLEEAHIATTRECQYLISIGPHYIHNDPRHLCPICVTDEVDNAIVPCGHTYCSKCAVKCDMLTCFLCRNKIEKVIKLYYI